jgi:hypothetical protein
MAELRGLIVNDSGSINLPSGTEANRPTTTPSVQTFTTVGTTSWTAPAGVNEVEVLVVAGGGGGGYDNGGGGGAGGLIYESNYKVTPGQSYTVIVGGGGSGASSGNASGAQGGNSRFEKLTAIGGGGAGSDTAGTGQNGGSGGGAGGYNETPPWPAGKGTAGQGHAGASGRFSSGGGGAGGTGQSGYGDNLNVGSWIHGRGGPGLKFAITGTPTWYAGGGGGGGAGSNIGGEGGVGGGGRGSDGSTYNPGTGVANTGGGGGGGPGSTTPRTGGTGGSGIVVVRYFLDADSENPSGQVRFNTAEGTLETFSGNVWKSKGLVTNGLQAYYDGNDYTQGSSLWSDLSGNNNNATIDGTPIKLSDNGGALDFRVNGVRFRTSLVYGAANTSFSYGGWVKLMQANQSANLFPLSNYWDGGKSGFFAITTNYGGKETFLWVRNDGGDPSVQTTRAPIEPYQWYYLFAVRDHANNRAILYINGEQVAEAEFAGSYSVTEAGDANSTLGGATHSSGFTRCMIGNVQAYNRALSPEEVRQNYNHFKNRYYEPGASVVNTTTDIEKPAIHKENLTFYVDAAVRPSFENGDRTYWRDLASGNSALLSGNPYWTPEYGGYLDFDGSDNKGEMQNIRLGNGDKQWTAMAWIRTTTGVDALGQGSVLSNRSGGPVYSMMGVNGGRIVYWTYYSSAWQKKSGTYTVNDGNWRMLTWVNHSNKTMRMYMDDRFDSFHDNSTSGNNNPIDILGASWAARADMDIAAIMIYENRALNHQEISQNFEAMRRRFGR